MNILIPDSWLREYLSTNAKPEDIFKYLSLCGPTVERYDTVQGEPVYEIEVTTNRIDAFSVFGIAREASVILPQFGFYATLKPLEIQKIQTGLLSRSPLDIDIVNDPSLCHRILAIKLEQISLGPSPDWLKKRLEQVGERALNNAIDITNFVAHELGHPLHAFDYDRLIDKKIIVRLAKKGETLTTLDHKKITLTGMEIVFDNGKGEIIDFPGVIGTANTVVTAKTKNILLFSENSDASRIRKASMTHSIRSFAAQINEKSPDPEIAFTVIMRAVGLFTKLTNAKIGSKLIDIFPNKPEQKTITVPEDQLSKYLGVKLDYHKVLQILEALGFSASYSEVKNHYTARPPSYRAVDVQIPEDVIEEVARIYGYHTIHSKLPDSPTRIAERDQTLDWEEEIKIRLRDWGYTELYTYSMISDKLMEVIGWDKKKTYKIENPLSEDWLFMRPDLLASILTAVAQNQNINSELKLFELSMAYKYRNSDLPIEKPSLAVVWTGQKFLEAKGLAEALFSVFGVNFPSTATQFPDTNPPIYNTCKFSLGEYGSLGELNSRILENLGIKSSLTSLYLDFGKLVQGAHPIKRFKAIPKYPPVFEDFSFSVPEKFQIGPLIESLKSVSPIIVSAKLIDDYKQTRTLRVSYLDPTKNLSAQDVLPIREKILRFVKDHFKISLRE